MKWLDRDGSSVSGGYRVVRTIKGFEAWIFDSKRSGVLGRGISTLTQAKALCEQHKAKEGACSNPTPLVTP